MKNCLRLTGALVGLFLGFNVIAALMVALTVPHDGAAYGQDKKPKFDTPGKKEPVPAPKVEKAPSEPAPKGDKAPPDPAPKADKAPPAKEPAGKVQVDVKTTSLKKFKAEVTTPSPNHPPMRPGGSWHWHRWHGWIWFPTASAPLTTLIPVDFVLPPTVVYFDPEATPVPTTVRIICPHCGRPVLVYLP